MVKHDIDEEMQKEKIEPSFAQILKRFKLPSHKQRSSISRLAFNTDPYLFFKLPNKERVAELGIAKKLLKTYPEFDFWRTLDMGDYFPSFKFIIKKRVEVE